VDDTWVSRDTQAGETFTERVNLVDSSIKFTREDVKENKLHVQNYAVLTEEKRSPYFLK